MSRPLKCRRVDFLPGVNHFKPAGIPLRMLEEVNVSIEEVEAIRLKDLEGLEQEQCAQRMNVSRPTFHRVLSSARHKVALALLTGKAIRIEGGNFEIAQLRLRCINGHEWNVPFDAVIGGDSPSCPECANPNIVSLQPPSGNCMGGGWGKHRRGKGSL